MDQDSQRFFLKLCHFTARMRERNVCFVKYLSISNPKSRSPSSVRPVNDGISDCKKWYVPLFPSWDPERRGRGGGSNNTAFNEEGQKGLFWLRYIHLGRPQRVLFLIRWNATKMLRQNEKCFMSKKYFFFFTIGVPRVDFPSFWSLRRAYNLAEKGTHFGFFYFLPA